jgi:hypothetical protein
MRPFYVVQLEEEIARVSRVEGRLSTRKRRKRGKRENRGQQ